MRRTPRTDSTSLEKRVERTADFMRLRRLMRLYERLHGSTKKAMRVIRRDPKIRWVNPKRRYPMDSDRLHDYERTLPYYTQIQRVLNQFVPSIRGQNILHVGASTGIYTEFLQSLGAKSIAVDTNKSALRASKNAGQKRNIVADAHRLPFENESIHCFISDHFLFSKYEKISNNRVLSELWRVLKPGGIGIISQCIIPESIHDPKSDLGKKWELVHLEEEKIILGMDEMGHDLVVLSKKK